MSPKSSDYYWGGKQKFLVSGTKKYSDTLKIRTNSSGIECLLSLELPTLCVTYSDLDFANAVGGNQENYPASERYGSHFFDPPLEFQGDEVEKFTWIRGAEKVTIGPKITTIIWWINNDLIIPRLRIDPEAPVSAFLVIPQIPISVKNPLIIDVMQYADGRQTGGIRMEKRHPQWIPPRCLDHYDLTICVTNGKTQEPMPEVMVNLLQWNDKKLNPFGQGGFKISRKAHTDNLGTVQFRKRPSGNLEAVTLNLFGWRSVAHCYRPLPGEKVTINLIAWKMVEDTVRYVWKPDDNLKSISSLTGYSEKEILHLNSLRRAGELNPGITINLPCFEAWYYMEAGDSFEWLAKSFAYSDTKELIKANGISDISEITENTGIRLPGWHYFYAREDESLLKIDAMFDLPGGWSRTVGRVHHVDPRLPYELETIAIPTKEFIMEHTRM